MDAVKEVVAESEKSTSRRASPRDSPRNQQEFKEEEDNLNHTSQNNEPAQIETTEEADN